MKILVTLVTLLFAVPSLACNSDLLDQDFRMLASKDELNLCEADAHPFYVALAQ